MHNLETGSVGELFYVCITLFCALPVMYKRMNIEALMTGSSCAIFAMATCSCCRQYFVASLNVPDCADLVLRAKNNKT